MDRHKRKKPKKFKKRLIIMFFVIMMLLFVETFYKYINRMDANLVQAEKISGYRGVELANSKVYTSYKRNKRLFEEELLRAQQLKKLKENESLEDSIEETEEEVVEKEEEVIVEPEQVEETVESEQTKDPTKEQEDIAYENRKIAYLTFDDGPSTYMTPKVLDILKSYDIKATFFVVGNSAEKNPDILRRIYEEGHAIGNHTYSHKYGYIYKNPSNFIQELEIAERVFKNILGEEFETNIMRFPGGSFGDKREPFRKAVVEQGYKYIDWNSLNGDAEGHHIPKHKLVERFKSTFSNQQELVVLMHDTDAKETTPQALPDMIKFLIENGYEFATL